jgi:hypothetical protein
MKRDKDHIHYSTEYLQQYLNGELTDREMQALEKDALEDPFLSDVIEGLEEARKHAPSFESGVVDLQRRLAEKVSEQKRKTVVVRMFPRWRVAASILMLGAVTAIAMILLRQNSRQNPISVVQQKDTQSVVVQPAPAVVQNSAGTIKTETKTAPPEPAPVALADEKDKSIAANRKQAPASPVPNKEKKHQDSLSYVQGIVLDDSGRAIASATVSLSGEDKETVTDKNGYFKLYVQNDKKEQELAINSIGYKPVHAAVSDNSLLEIQMQNATASLDEVVVSGYGTQKKKDVAGSVTVVSDKNIQPAGWLALNEYINKNKKINSADSVLKGEEIISFVVNQKGKISSIKVIQSISPSHDAEVIRLLKSGPGLQTTDGKKQQCRISVYFN